MHVAKLPIVCVCLVLTNWLNGCRAVIHGTKEAGRHHRQELAIQTVSLTQRGYIQFLRYVVDVPPISEYTFCIWIKSTNLTHQHSLLSYSKHEEDRLIRAWISAYGTEINLAILEVPIFKVPFKFNVDHWYHICQSWSSSRAAWHLYLNGKLKASGFEPKLKGLVIENEGDLIVGQEYTDFDKGLDDGIEGDIFGFNFLLSATTDKFPPETRRYNRQVNRQFYTKPMNRLIAPLPKNNFWDDIFNFLDFSSPNQRYIRRLPPNRATLNNPQRILNDIHEVPSKNLALKLVELSYDCTLGKGAPIKAKELLVSWTKTPVRVFGGAIIKNAPAFCVF